MAGIQEKIRRVRGPAAALSPRGAIPAEAVRLVQSDRWTRTLGRIALGTAIAVVVLFIVFKFVLISGASALSTLFAGLVK
jgi:hypothetical protein